MDSAETRTQESLSSTASPAAVPVQLGHYIAGHPSRLALLMSGFLASLAMALVVHWLLWAAVVYILYHLFRSWRHVRDHFM